MVNRRRRPLEVPRDPYKPKHTPVDVEIRINGETVCRRRFPKPVIDKMYRDGVPSQDIPERLYDMLLQSTKHKIVGLIRRVIRGGSIPDQEEIKRNNKTVREHRNRWGIKLHV